MAHSKHQEVLTQAVHNTKASSNVTSSWARLVLALQQAVAEAEHAVAFADYSATARSKFLEHSQEFSAAAALWAILPRWISLVLQLLREAGIEDRISATAGMARAASTRLRASHEESRNLLDKSRRQRSAELDWVRFMLQLVAMKMLPAAWAHHHRGISAWVGRRCASIQHDVRTEAAAETQHRYFKEIWARMVLLQLHAKEGKHQQAAIRQHIGAAKQAASTAALKADETLTDLQQCKRELEAQRRLSREERWARITLSILRSYQSDASFTNLKTVTSQAASQRRMSELHLQQVEADRHADSLRALEEMDIATAKAAAEVATVGVQEAAMRRWQLLVLFTFQLQHRVCNQYVLNAVATQQRAVQHIALENSTMRPHLAGLQAEVALAWWARFATYLYLQATAHGTRRMLSDFMTFAHAGTRTSSQLQLKQSTCAMKWHRLSHILTMEGPSQMLHVLRASQEVQSRRREALHAQQMSKMQETVQAHAAHALAAHQMLIQQSKRTLVHVRRFGASSLAPTGLEEHCELALQRCGDILGQDVSR